MLRTSYHYYCDICGFQVYSAEEAKSLSVSAAGEMKFEEEHTCKACRHAIYVAIGRAMKERRS